MTNRPENYNMSKESQVIFDTYWPEHLKTRTPSQRDMLYLQIELILRHLPNMSAPDKARAANTIDHLRKVYQL